MAITIEEFEKYLEECYAFKAAMEGAESRDGFEANQKALRELADNLSSNSGEYYPSFGRQPIDTEDAKKLLARSNALQAEAKELLKFSMFARYSGN